MGVIQEQASKNTIISYIGLVLGAINILYLYRIYFTIEEFGLISLLAAIMIVFSQLSALGVVNTIIRFFPFFKTENKKHQGFIAWMSLITVFGFLLFTLVYLIFKPLIEDAFINNSPIFLKYYYSVIPLAFFALIFNVLEAIARTIHKTVYSAFLKEVLFRFLTMIGIILVAYNLLAFYDFVIYFVIINGFIALLLCIQVISSKEFKYTINLKTIPFSEVNDFFRYGLYSLFAFSAYYITLNIDRIMLGSLIGVDIVGIYAIFLFVGTVVAFPKRAMTRIVVPIIADCWKRNDKEQIDKLYKSTSLVLLIISFLIYIGIVVNEHNVMKVLNKPELYGHFNIFIFIGMAFLIDAVGAINSDILSTSKKFRYDTLFNFLFLLTGVILNYILIPVYGGMGAALATVASMIVFNIGKWFFIKRKFNMQPFSIKHMIIILTGIFSIVIGINLPEIPNIILDIIYRSTIVSIIYLGIIIPLRISKDINEYFFSFINKLKKIS